MFSLNAYTLCTTKMQNDMGKKKEKFLTAPPPHSVTWYSQEPINSQDKTDVISGQSHRGQHHQHSDETSTRDTRSSYTGTRGCQAKTKKRHWSKFWWNQHFIKFQYEIWYKLFFEKFTMLFWITKKKLATAKKNNNFFHFLKNMNKS